MITTLKNRLKRIQNNTPMIPKSKIRLVTGKIVTLIGTEIIDQAIDGQIQEIIDFEDGNFVQLAWRLSGETIKMPVDFIPAE